MQHSQRGSYSFWIGGLVLGVVVILISSGLIGNFSATLGVNAAQSSGAFAQLSSLKTQQPTTTAPAIMTFDQIDGINKMGFNLTKPTDLVAQEAGTYLVIAAGQVGRAAGADNPADYADLWIRVNGKDVDNSNTRQSIREAAFTAVLVSQGILVLKAGDVIQVAYSVSAAGKGLGIIATKPQNEPAIPSIILSVAKMP
jgi:hypothetical protein